MNSIKSDKNYITPHGLEILKKELRFLRDEDRPAVVKTVAWAASNGDRSENADYIYGKRRLREIDKRIEFLKTRLEKAVVVDPCTQDAKLVLFGATVTVLDGEGRSRTFSIVGADEVNIEKKRISWLSPMGQALLRTKVGDLVMVKTPKGDEELEISQIQYLEIK